MLLYTFAILWANSLRLFSDSYYAELKFLNKYVSPPITMEGVWLNALLCFILLCVSTRYFQVNVHINRRYDYIHELEDKFAHLLECTLISREGKSYLSKYPWFSSYTHIVYTLIIPVIILVFSIFSTIKHTITYLCQDTSLEHEYSIVPFILCLVPLIMTAISSLLYILLINSKDKTESEGGTPILYSRDG